MQVFAVRSVALLSMGKKNRPGHVGSFITRHCSGLSGGLRPDGQSAKLMYAVYCLGRRQIVPFSDSPDLR